MLSAKEQASQLVENQGNSTYDLMYEIFRSNPDEATRLAVVRAILEMEKANVNTTMYLCDTRLLDYAIRYRGPQLVLLLLGYGADWTICELASRIRSDEAENQFVREGWVMATQYKQNVFLVRHTYTMVRLVHLHRCTKRLPVDLCKLVKSCLY